MKTIKIIKQLGKKLESGTYSPLEEFNIKMYIPTISNPEALSCFIDKEIKDQKYLKENERMESGIKITRWVDGTHYYAKIFDQDVVDESGNQKWDSYSEAMSACKRFIILNNSKN